MVEEDLFLRTDGARLCLLPDASLVKLMTTGQYNLCFGLITNNTDRQLLAKALRLTHTDINLRTLDIYLLLGPFGSNQAVYDIDDTSQNKNSTNHCSHYDKNHHLTLIRRDGGWSIVSTCSFVIEVVVLTDRTGGKTCTGLATWAALVTNCIDIVPEVSISTKSAVRCEAIAQKAGEASSFVASSAFIHACRAPSVLEVTSRVAS